MFEYRRLKRMVDAGWSTSVNDTETSSRIYVTFTRGEDRVKIMLIDRIAEKILAYDKGN